MYLAGWFAKRPEDEVKCVLCPHLCEIKSGHEGKCRVRINNHGNLYSKNYGEVAAIGLDPIEKKPLYHFYPKNSILSIGSYGCNLRCDFCQNWQLAHQVSHGEYFSPKQMLELACRYMDEWASIGLAYTYSEPSMWYEFIRDTAPLIEEKGMKNVLVSNGFLNKKPFREILQHVHALNIDVKAFSEKFYKENTGGFLKPVLDNCIIAKEEGRHLEITTLIIPGLNDSQKEIENLSKWLAAIDKNIPLHFSRYFPSYKMRINETPLETLEKAWAIAKEHLEFVYIGNAPSLKKADTYCPACGDILVWRRLYGTEVLFSDKGECQKCGNKLVGTVINDL